MENPPKAKTPSYKSATSSLNQAIKWGFKPTTSPNVSVMPNIPSKCDVMPPKRDIWV
jgi:hypothetical protein